MEYLAIDEIHDELLSLLIIFDSFCKDNSLRYSITAGTLLGAVRHKGFIPWDADVDVSMPRPDYERLLLLEDKLPIDTGLITNNNSNFGYPFAKFMTEKVRAQEASTEGLSEGYLWLDIFPMDGITGSENEWALRRTKMFKAKRKMSWLSVNVRSAYKNSLAKRLIVGSYHSLPGRESRRKKQIQNFDELVSQCDYKNASKVTSICSDVSRAFSLDKEKYEAMIEMEFEGYMLPVMGCWKEYLEISYGDYMTPPPENQRIDHHNMKAWRVR